MRLSLRSRLALGAGHLVAAGSRLARRGRGQVIGGRIMLRVDPGLISALAAGRQISLVSATNGKSTTTRFLAEALRQRGGVAHNLTGANMAEGIVTALAGDRDAPYAALEVDEAHLPSILAATGADVVVLMNLSRDQLDRGAEVKRLAQRWRAMLAQTGHRLTVVANADDPLVVWAAGGLDNGDVVWVACGQRWREDSDLCPACSQTLRRGVAPDDGGAGSVAWSCPACGLARPETTWAATADGVRLPSGQLMPVTLRLPGAVNIGNAAIAMAAASLRGVDPATAGAALVQVGDVDGRYFSAEVAGHQLRLLLGKNPASWMELIDIVRTSGRQIVGVLNARGADGRDPSWLWDVRFEELAGRSVWVSGERRFDLASRLDTAGLQVVGVVADPLDALTQLEPGQAVDIVANYTAFQDLRARVVA